MQKLLILFISLLSFVSNAQFGSFWNTRTQTNPAFQALEHEHFANVNYRNIYPSLSGSYNSTTVSYGAHIQKIKGGLGFYYNRENWARSYESNAIKLAYNYQMPLGENARLSFGTGIGAIFSSYDAIIDPWNSYYPSSGTSFGLDFGSALIWKKLQLGVGVQNVFETDDVARYLNKIKSFNAMAQYVFGKESGLQFIPQALCELAFNYQTISLNGKFGYKNKYFVSGGIILNNSYMGTIEMLLREKLRLTYSYQHTVSQLSNGVVAGSHEMGLCIELGKR